ADPSESSPTPVFVAPMVLPFLCLDNSESDTEMPERHVSPTSCDAMLTSRIGQALLRFVIVYPHSRIPFGLLNRDHVGNSINLGVRIKRLHDDVRVTTAQKLRLLRVED
nr:hypothetical protein [Tanacetum cinerariifolium]